MELEISYGRMTDEAIDRLSQNRVITTYNDFNLRRGSKFEKNRLFPYVGGVYDSDFFGSIYTDTCNCGRVHTVGDLCQNCGSRVLTEEEKYKRYARIDLNMYYVMDDRVLGLVDLLSDLPLNIDKARDFFEFSRISQGSAFQIAELCQFDWNDKTGEVDVTPYITDVTHSSYEGLEIVIKEHFPDMYDNFRSLVNSKVLVIPAAYRMATFNPYDPYTKISVPMMSSVFQAVVRIRMEIQALFDSGKRYMEPMEQVALKATLRRYCAKIPYWVSQSLKTSKETANRAVLSARLDESGRAPIVGDPSLEIDQVKLPISIAYELMRVDFIAYIAKSHSVSPIKAELIYKKHSQKTLDEFAEYCKGRRVIMNRPPSLHRYNNMAFRILLTDDQAIHFPPTSVVPFAADYDGDQMSVFLVPEEFNDLVDKNASPKTQLRYESSGEFIWKPNQDMLYGLILATRIIPSPDDDSITLKYNNFEDLEKDYEAQVITYPTDHVIMSYMSEEVLTSYSREKVSQIIRKPISDIYGAGYPNASNIDELLTYLYGLDDFTTVYRDLIQFALEVITLEGATVPSLKEMISVDTSKFTDRLKELIARSHENPKYYAELELEYSKFVEDQVKKMSSDLTRRVNDSGRMKMSQIIEMMIPQMTVNYKGEYYVATNSIVNGLSHEDYVHHAVNNRANLQMKQAITPKGGYLNRQLIYAGQGVRMHRNGNSGVNEGVWIPRNHAEGRTTLDGEILGPSESKELVLVRSYAMSKTGVMTPDLISESTNEFNDNSNIGLKITSAVAGSVTQGGLSLKHTGTLRKLNMKLSLTANGDCTVRRLTIDTIEIKYDEDDRKITHYVPQDFLLVSDTGKYKKSDLIGFRPVFSDPGANSKCIIDLLGGTSTDDMGAVKHAKDLALCVTPVGGKIHYDLQYIHIGSLAIPRDPERVYYYFEGEEVDPYTIICDGVLDCTNIVSYCPQDRDYYGCFRSYFLTLLPRMNEQTVEYVFTTINSSDEDNNLMYTGIKQKVREDKSIMTNLGYEGAARIIQSILESPTPVTDSESSYNDLFGQYYLTILTQ